MSSSSQEMSIVALGLLQGAQQALVEPRHDRPRTDSGRKLNVIIHVRRADRQNDDLEK